MKNRFLANKFFLAAIAVAMVLILSFITLRWYQKSHHTQERLEQISRPDYVFKEMNMVELSGPQKFWEMQSQHSEIRKGEAYLDNPEGLFYRRNTRYFAFVAPRAQVNMKYRRMQLFDATGRFIRMRDPWHVKSAYINLNPENESIYARKPLRFWNEKSDISGDELFVRGDDRWSIVSGNAVVNFLEKVQNSTMRANKVQVDTDSDFLQAQGNVHYQNSNLIIDSRFMDYWRDKNSFRFYGQSELTQEDVTILADEFKSVRITANVTASGNVKFTQKDIRVTGQHLLYNHSVHKAYVSGNITAFQGNRRMVGKTVVVDTKLNRLDTEGRSQVVVSRNVEGQ